ncbi:hypothetical protein BRADI_3g07820v3 [Brachypodium distachyon]|uniref:F-box domain-containing protein n=1 Tax=Brachypodium distachyon TaxID=15368 RepID=A0A2K2CVU7_BRADI|nr:hypothetical protein BRADI_3g07820v3 [Brachypodium distachyon]
MATQPPALRHRNSPPAIPDELSEEILLRLPPGDPSCLVRASAVCKRWRRLVSQPSFLRRLHELHGTPPPLLGFFHSDYSKRFAARVTQEAQDFLVWEPITGHQRILPVPGAPKSYVMDAAVVCAADGCDHRDCHRGPFRLVLVYIVPNVDLLFVRAYSSHTGSWGDVSTVTYEPIMENSSVLVGKSLYFFSIFDRMVKYDLTGHGALSVINLPEPEVLADCCGNTGLVLTRERELGVAGVMETRLYLWSSMAGDKGELQSKSCRVIELHNMLPAAALSASESVDVVGFAEEANVIFLKTIAGVFAINVESEPARKVYQTSETYETLTAFSSFYIPGKRVASAGGGEGTP